MSRLLSFLKKKDGGEYPPSGSPPPSPKSRTDSDYKSVKQIKKRRKDKKLRKMQQKNLDEAENEGEAAMIIESSGDFDGPNDYDSNGNSMTEIIDDRSSMRHHETNNSSKRSSSKSTDDGDADSLRDVDSICEEYRYVTLAVVRVALTHPAMCAI